MNLDRERESEGRALDETGLKELKKKILTGDIFIGLGGEGEGGRGME